MHRGGAQQPSANPNEQHHQYDPRNSDNAESMYTTPVKNHHNNPQRKRDEKRTEKHHLASHKVNLNAGARHRTGGRDEKAVEGLELDQ